MPRRSAEAPGRRSTRPERLVESPVDLALMPPRGREDEIVEQMGRVEEWGARSVVAIPGEEVCG